MTYRPDPDHELDPDGMALTIHALRTVLVEIQRSDLMRVNALRALLGLHPVRAPGRRDRGGPNNGEQDNA